VNAFTPVGDVVIRAADLVADAPAVDAFLDGHPDATPFHRPAWSRAVERGCGQRAHYLIAWTEHGFIAGVLPLTAVRSQLFGSALASAGFAVGGGILARDERVAAALADTAWAMAGPLQCGSIELRGGWLPAGWERQEGIYAGFARSLPQGDEAILKSIPRKQRAEVRRGQQMSMEVLVGRSADDLAAHYRVYSESVRNLGTPVFPRRLFTEMAAAFGDGADVLTVRYQGRAVASVFSFYMNGTVYPYWGGGTFAARGLRANERMYFELMRHAAARGCTRFDFGRSKIGTGAYAYKKNWGFEPKPLVYAIRTGSNADGREINPLSPRYRLQVALWRRLPLWAANRLGPPIARGLG
jgi:FemAB-related protein (PEP-CTERM system-associated)